MNLWKSFSPTPIPTQSHLEQATQECIQMSFKCLWRGRLHDLPGQLFQSSVTLNVKKYYLTQGGTSCGLDSGITTCPVAWIFKCFLMSDCLLAQLWTIPVVLTLDLRENSPVPPSPASLPRKLQKAMLPNLHFSEGDKPRALSCSF